MKLNFVVTLITATLAIGVASCSSDEQSTLVRSESASTTATPVTMSAFGEDSSDLGYKINRQNATAIVEAVEERGGTREQAIAALLAGKAETGWTSGLTLPPPATAIADIYGWRFSYNIGADSTDAVRAATYTFMGNTAAVDIDPGDPAAYALAVQQAGTREYLEEKRFFKNNETAASEYAQARPVAETAYAELRGTQ